MQAAALELSRRVWEPLKPHLQGTTTVLVAPPGALTYFPLAALPGHRAGTYLIEDISIGYVSSAQRLVEILAAPNEAKPKSPEAELAGLLAVGGIDYQADPGGAAPSESAPTPGVLLAESQRAGFKALAGTEPEVRSIAQLFGASFPGCRNANDFSRSDGCLRVATWPRVGMTWPVANLVDEFLVVVEPSRAEVEHGLGVGVVVPEFLAPFGAWLSCLTHDSTGLLVMGNPTRR